MRKFLLQFLLIFTGLILGQALAESPQPESRANSNDSANYNDLTHTIKLTKLRSGNHNKSKINDYRFEATIYTLLLDKKERKIEFAERKKITHKLGTIAEIKIKPLSTWIPQETAATDLIVSGDLIRDLTAQTMQQFGVKEEQVAAKIEILLIQKNKKYFVLNDNKVIGSASYYPIPETLPRRLNINNESVSIIDDMGLISELTIKYEQTDGQAENPK